MAIQWLAPARDLKGGGLVVSAVLWVAALLLSGTAIMYRDEAAQCTAQCYSSSFCWATNISNVSDTQLCYGAAASCTDVCASTSNFSAAITASYECTNSRCRAQCDNVTHVDLGGPKDRGLPTPKGDPHNDCDMSCRRENQPLCEAEAGVPLALDLKEQCEQDSSCAAIRGEEMVAVTMCNAPCQEKAAHGPSDRARVLSLAFSVTLTLLATLSASFYEEALEWPRCQPAPLCWEVLGRLALYVSILGASLLLVYVGLIQSDLFHTQGSEGFWSLAVAAVLFFAFGGNVGLLVLALIARCFLARKYEPVPEAEFMLRP